MLKLVPLREPSRCLIIPRRVFISPRSEINREQRAESKRVVNTRNTPARRPTAALNPRAFKNTQKTKVSKSKRGCDYLGSLGKTSERGSNASSSSRWHWWDSGQGAEWNPQRKSTASCRKHAVKRNNVKVTRCIPFERFLLRCPSSPSHVMLYRAQTCESRLQGIQLYRTCTSSHIIVRFCRLFFRC